MRRMQRPKRRARGFDRVLVLGTYGAITLAALPFGCGGQSSRRSGDAGAAGSGFTSGGVAGTHTDGIPAGRESYPSDGSPYPKDGNPYPKDGNPYSNDGHGPYPMDGSGPMDGYRRDGYVGGDGFHFDGASPDGTVFDDGEFHVDGSEELDGQQADGSSFDTQSERTAAAANDAVPPEEAPDVD